MSAKTVLSVREAAQLLGWSDDWVYKRIWDGTMPGAFRYRHRWYIERITLEEKKWLRPPQIREEATE